MYGGNGSSVDNGEEDWLCGGKGHDLLFGNEGRDNLNGDEGDDTLYGGKDNDILTGGTGNDWLFGDLGQDLLRGGEGRDFFALTRSQGTDVILDFTDGEDLLVLRGGLTFAQLNLIDSNGSALIGVQNSSEILAILPGVQASLLGQQDFIAIA
jgi:Ca2+-binding RTX toxin-like protein